MSKHLSPREEKPSLSPLGAAAEPMCRVLGNGPSGFPLFEGGRKGKKSWVSLELWPSSALLRRLQLEPNGTQMFLHPSLMIICCMF